MTPKSKKSDSVWPRYRPPKT